MKFLKNVLTVLGILFVVSTLIYAVKYKEEDIPKKEKVATVKTDPENSYKISAIDIPDNLEFAGEMVPSNDPEVKERIDREFLVNTFWQSNALVIDEESK